MFRFQLKLQRRIHICTRALLGRKARWQDRIRRQRVRTLRERPVTDAAARKAVRGDLHGRPAARRPRGKNKRDQENYRGELRSGGVRGAYIYTQIISIWQLLEDGKVE